MKMKTRIAKNIVRVGATICRVGVNFAGGGRIDIEIFVSPEQEQLFWRKCCLLVGITGVSIGSFLMALLIAGELT